MVLNTDPVIESYFKQENIIISHQINSYNYYVDEIIPKILSERFPVIINFNDNNCSIRKIELGLKKLRIGKPLMVENNGCSKLMTPQMARIRNITYLSPIIVDFVSKITIEENGSFIDLRNL